MQNLHTVILMYNLLEYFDNYYMTPGSLWNYYIDEVDNVNVSDGKIIKV